MVQSCPPLGCYLDTLPFGGKGMQREFMWPGCQETRPPLACSINFRIMSSHSINHQLPTKLSMAPRSTAYWARIANGELLLFVHGFGGHAEYAWTRFPQLLLQNDSTALHDLLFFGYESTRISTEEA